MQLGYSNRSPSELPIHPGAHTLPHTPEEAKELRKRIDEDKNASLRLSANTKKEKTVRRRGPMDRASDFGSEGCGFESHRRHYKRI